MSKASRERPAAVRMSSEVAREIRQHARSSKKTEVCGVLIGRESEDGGTTVVARVAGVNAAEGGTHVTFTQDTWEYIYKIKDRDYPNERVVGWYHSHPGFGVFLSDHDTFIHKNFFSSPQQVAWVYDPHSDEEGCFGWRGERIERLAHFSFVDGRGGEVAGGSNHPPARTETKEEQEEGEVNDRGQKGSEEDSDLSRLSRTVSTLFSHLALFLLGAVLAWYLFPRVVVMPVPVDPQTGMPLRGLPEAPSSNAAPSRPYPQEENRSPAGSGQTKPDNTKRNDVHK